MNGHSDYYYKMLNEIIEETKNPFLCPIHGQYPKNYDDTCEACKFAELNYDKAWEHQDDIK